jgi:hypothetical protein
VGKPFQQHVRNKVHAGPALFGKVAKDSGSNVA